jgi:hypothetical protein
VRRGHDLGKRASARTVTADHDHMIKHSRLIEPINRSACPFCHCDRGAVGLLRMPIARMRRVNASAVDAVPITHEVLRRAKPAIQLDEEQTISVVKPNPSPALPLQGTFPIGIKVLS